MVDGLVLNKIPLRARQVVFPMAVGIVYVIWTIIHWKLKVGNPGEDYDTIYLIFDYENHLFFSLVQCTLLVLVVIPLVFLCLRMASLWSGGFKFDGSTRRTVTKNRLETKETVGVEDDIESLPDIGDWVMDEPNGNA